MKALKVILIIIVVLFAAVLIVPLFSPSPAVVSAEIEIGVKPSQIFPNVASFTDRGEWDPWLTMDSTAVPEIISVDGFVGSSYTWEGERLGTGKMQIDSVVKNEYIKASLWFGEMQTPSSVEWNFSETSYGTMAVWTFTEETAYPFGRLRMMLGKIFMKQSFEMGLANLKEYLEANPPAIVRLGPISKDILKGHAAMAAKGSGIVQEIGGILGNLFGSIMGEIGSQGLQVNGAPFVIYHDYDAETGMSNFTVCMPVAKAGVKSGDVVPVVLDDAEALMAMHTGPYEEFESSYKIFESYIEENGIEVSGEVVEIYLTGPMTEADPENWQTLIAYLLK